jgi:hypothetical protein
MDRIAFSTNKGRTFKAGGGGGDFYQITMVAPKGKECRVIALGGTHHDHMESLYAHYMRVEKVKTNDKDIVENSRNNTSSIIEVDSQNHN